VTDHDFIPARSGLIYMIGVGTPGCEKGIMMSIGRVMTDDEILERLQGLAACPREPNTGLAPLARALVEHWPVPIETRKG
jgi:hypothetical protein